MAAAVMPWGATLVADCVGGRGHLRTGKRSDTLLRTSRLLGTDQLRPQASRGRQVIYRHAPSGECPRTNLLIY